MFICKNFILYVFLKILQTCYFGYFGHAWLCTPKNDSINLQRIFVFKKQNINFVPHVFLEILQRYVYKLFLFWVLWECMATQTQNHSINLQKTLMSICMPKINFTIHLFFGILHFKESCSLIGQQHFEPSVKNQHFVRYEIFCHLEKKKEFKIITCS